MPSVIIFNSTRQTIVATRVRVADTSQTHSVGLLKHERLEPGEGLYIPGRNWLPFMAVHTIRMKFSIDVLFLDKNNRVAALYTLPPNRIAWGSGARGALEVAEGAIVGSQTQIGDKIEMRLPQILKQNERNEE